MRKSDFIKKLAAYCEFENQELTMDTPFKSIEGYDSMAILSMIAFIDETFNIKFSTQQIKNLTDINSLIVGIGEEKFNN